MVSIVPSSPCNFVIPTFKTSFILPQQLISFFSLDYLGRRYFYFFCCCLFGHSPTLFTTAAKRQIPGFPQLYTESRHSHRVAVISGTYAGFCIIFQCFLCACKINIQNHFYTVLAEHSVSVLTSVSLCLLYFRPYFYLLFFSLLQSNNAIHSDETANILISLIFPYLQPPLA